MRKPRRWIEHMKIDLRGDREHRRVIEEIGFTDYLQTGLVRCTDAEVAELIADPAGIRGSVRVPTLPPSVPYTTAPITKA